MSLTQPKDHRDAPPRKGSRRPAEATPRPRRPDQPEFWRSPLRGPWLTSLLGTMLVPAIAVMAVTGLISHWAYHPELSTNATEPPGFDLPILLQFTSAWPAWSYAATQGTHVVLGLMTVPLLLAKLWSVFPKLFRRPAWRSVAGAVERLSLLLLVGSVLIEFATGILEIDEYPRTGLSFYSIHYYGAWVFVTLFVLHALVKLPTVRRAYRERGMLKPLRDSLKDTRPEPPSPGGLAPVDPAPPTLSRRGLLAMIGGASVTIFAVQSGASIGGPLRRFALLAARGRVFGTGPNDFPVTNTAASRQVTARMTGAGWRLTVTGARSVSLDRETLLAMPQSTHELTLTCTEGWSTTQHWTGVPLASLAGLVAAPRDAVLVVRSVEEGYETSFSQAQLSDRRALLALRVNGADLSPDHGYPARVIFPNVPGTHNIKWVGELRFMRV
jgi:DMSO/TMAO reductase YedYZ molybdopterin-dependent catalytic subunit